MVEAEPFEHRQGEVALPGNRDLPVQARVVHAVGVLCDLRDEGNEAALELVEDFTDDVCLQALIEVVQQDVVLAVVAHALEAVDVLVLEIDVLLQEREEDREVGFLACLDPGGESDRPGPCQLGAQLGRDPLCLLVVAARDADQAGVVGVGIEALLVVADILEQPADLVVDEKLVRETVERPQLLGPQRASLGGHHRVLVPAEDGSRHVQVVDSGQARLELFELLRHGCLRASLAFGAYLRTSSV